jgi:hypothetical protein
MEFFKKQAYENDQEEFMDLLQEIEERADLRALIQ